MRVHTTEDDFNPQIQFLEITHKGAVAAGSIIRSGKNGDYISAADAVEQSVYEMAHDVSHRYQLRKISILEQLVVPEQLRGQGIGTRLVKHFIAIQRIQKVQIILLRANPPDKQDFDRLIKFYKSLGFTVPDDTKPAQMEQILQKKIIIQKKDYINDIEALYTV
jgi:GNAT superfamily N-acetyltransferase